MQHRKLRPFFVSLSAAQHAKWRLVTCRCIALGILLFSCSTKCTAQEVTVAGSAPVRKAEPVKSPKKNPTPPKPVAARQNVYFDIHLVPDEDCIITIDGVKQKDTLRMGLITVKKLTTGTHWIGAESITSGYVHNQPVKVEGAVQKSLEIPIKEQFEQHLKKVDAALSQQQ